MKEKPEEKAIPEPILVKREMLYSYSEAALNLSKYLRNTRENKEKFENFKIWIRDLFQWLEMKIDFNNKNYKCLKKLQDWIKNPNGVKIKYKEWIDFWFALRLKMEELNITKIEMAEEDLATAFLR